ncbi:hypothetical protein F5X98DRAFT_313622 [Xylaria grammica]|nr:hypothetical protein F5X98DRAFT_313622 [Xylaria grammica]
MGDENALADGKKADSIDAGSDSERSERERGTTDMQSPPQYSVTNTAPHWNDNLTRQSPARTSGGDCKCLNQDREGVDPLIDDGPGNKTVLDSSNTDTVRDPFTATGGLLGVDSVTADAAQQGGPTPLLTAIETGHIETVRHLLEAGADPNEYGAVGVTKEPEWRGRVRGPPPSKIYRTPLQLAAAKGNLPIVKLLMETYGADDSLVAPDGELALRLASENGHREVVAYLPPRRGGGFRRWKTRHDVAMRRAKRAARGIYRTVEVVAFHIPKLFVWTLPKHVIVLPIVNRVKWLYQHRGELPRLVADALKRSWRALRKFPGDVWDVLKRIPGAVRSLTRAVVAMIWGIPRAVEIAALWIWSGIQALAGALGRVFNRLFSFLHTAIVAVGTFFRNITLKNVWDGFVTFVHAVIVEGPKRLWHWICRLPDVTVRMLEAIWGFIGELLGWLFWGLIKALIYVPRKLWEILASVFNSVGHGGKEVMIWINPKR